MKIAFILYFCLWPIACEVTAWLHAKRRAVEGRPQLPEETLIQIGGIECGFWLVISAVLFFTT